MSTLALKFYRISGGVAANTPFRVVPVSVPKEHERVVRDRFRHDLVADAAGEVTLTMVSGTYRLEQGDKGFLFVFPSREGAYRMVNSEVVLI